MKVSLLFLTYSEPIHTIEWMDYINNSNFNIVIHPKYPEKLEDIWKPFLSFKIVETKWGTDSIIIATLILLKQAFDLYDSDWFILCSEDSYPLLDSNSCLNYFNNKELSIFHPIDKNNPSKVSQWFALSKSDVSSIINNLGIDINYNIQNKQLYNSIINNISKKSAVDELFFIPLLQKINKNYEYDIGLIHYVKWIPDWVSKHPTIFNRLLPSDEISIRDNNALFIRKTFPTFKNETIIPKKNAVVITLGDDNIGKINYNSFLNGIKDTHDLYLLVMVDSMANVSKNLTSQCIQSYSVVWNMVEQAHKKIVSITDNTPHYQEVIILKENDNPYDYIRPKSPPRFRPVTPDFPPLNFDEKYLPIRPKSPNMPPPEENVSSIEFNPNYKIAYLFLLRGDINHPNIWSKYFISDSDPYVSKYVHSKEQDNIHTPWIRDSLIRDTRPTGWGYIVDAYFSLFREAIKDTNNLKFILISESCVPVKNYYEFKNYLDNTDYRNSYVHFLRTSRYDQEQRIKTQSNYKQFGKFTKHYARMCLSRYHVEKILSQSASRINFFINMHVGDEFFMTLLNAKPNEDYILDKTITYDNWDYVDDQVQKIKKEINKLKDEMKIKKNKNLESKISELENKMNDIRKNPKTYYKITPKDIEDVLRSGSFFWRKFPISLSLEQYYDLYGALIQIKNKGGTRKRRYKIKKTIKKIKNKNMNKNTNKNTNKNMNKNMNKNTNKNMNKNINSIVKINVKNKNKI
jgi:hypothetical protein